MTDLEQKAREIACAHNYVRDGAVPAVLAGMRWAAEECARICKEYASALDANGSAYASIAARQCWSRIRARFLGAREDEKPEAETANVMPATSSTRPPPASSSERAALVERAVEFWEHDSAEKPTVHVMADFALAETAELRKDNSDLRRHLDRRAIGSDPLTQAIRAERDAARAEVERLISLLGYVRTRLEVDSTADVELLTKVVDALRAARESKDPK